MKLSPGQLKEFDEQGYLFFPNCFSEEEIAMCREKLWNATLFKRTWDHFRAKLE